MGRPFWSRLALSAAIVCSVAADAGAQYFGRNKVRYDRDNVRILATDHFDIYYAIEDSAAAAIAGRLAERWHARLARALDHTLRGRQPVILYGSHRRFEQTNVYGGLIDESTGGFTDSRKRRIVLPFAGSLAETDHVLGHEIVHAFQFDIADQHRSPLTVPLWFIEGMAEYLTAGPDDPQTAMWMTDAVLSDKLPPIRELGSPQYFPYRWGAALWAHLAGRYGDDLPARALRAKRDLRRRLLATTGATLDELTASWHAALRETYGRRGERRADTSALVSSRRGGGKMNLAASLSPDGTRLVFLSERDQFSIDLFLADAKTGQTIRKLVSTAANHTYESLQYLRSAGAWDPSGSRYAIATVTSGRPAILLIDIDGPSPPRVLVAAGVDEIYSPTWAPDGRTLAVSAMKGGVSDLYLIDAATGTLRQLTDDAFADLQPAWSPDGRTIAFTTDRFTSSLGRLSFGGYRIGLIDPAATGTHAVEAIPARARTHQIDPVWAPGGSALYFVADFDGRGNVHRLDLATGRISRITDVETAVSGVTRVSPALSVASQSGALAYSVFRHGGYEIHTIAPPGAGDGTPVESAAIEPGPSTAPDDGEIEPVSLLSAVPPMTDVPDRYRPRLSLEAVGSPYFSAGGGPLGSYVSGGASLLFGDLLGNQQILTTVYVSSHFDESAVAALYVNRKSRWNWGATIEQVPQLRIRTNSVTVDASQPRVLTRERERSVWTNRHAGGFAAYPLSRSHRIELSAGFRGIGYERELRTETLSTVTGMLVDQETTPLAPQPTIGVVDAGVALVGDTAVFGATAPLLGSRYRLSATANTGGLRYTSVLADYRTYLMPIRPYTIALRIVHAGRYGVDSGDIRLFDAYLGSPTLVRGYGAGGVVRSECPRGSAECPALNTLLVNRYVAAKLEVRVPLWSALTRTSRVRYGPLPVDAFAFADAGTGWGGEQRFGPVGSDGRMFRSVGAGLRVNAVGLIAEVAAVRPLDLRYREWTFAFNLRPGF